MKQAYQIDSGGYRQYLPTTRYRPSSGSLYAPAGGGGYGASGPSALNVGAYWQGGNMSNWFTPIDQFISAAGKTAQLVTRAAPSIGSALTAIEGLF